VNTAITPAAVPDSFVDDSDCIALNAFRGGTLLRFTDGEYSDRDRNPIAIGTKLLALETDVCLQHWQDGKCETVFRDAKGKLPDV
jgi:hypothetical protein